MNRFTRIALLILIVAGIAVAIISLLRHRAPQQKSGTQATPPPVASSEPSAALQTIPAGWHTFSDRARPIAFSYPPHWTVAADDAVITLRPPGARLGPVGEYAAVINITLHEKSASETLDAYFHAQPHDPFAQTTAVTKKEIANHPAIIFHNLPGLLTETLIGIDAGSQVIEIDDLQSDATARDAMLATLDLP